MPAVGVSEAADVHEIPRRDRINGNAHDPRAREAGGPILGRSNRKKPQENHGPAGRAGTSLVTLGVGKDGVAVIRLEGSDGRNLLGPADIACLLELVDKVAETPSARALILEGGEHFSAGTDFPERMRHLLNPGSRPQVFRFLADQKTVCDKIRGLRIPTISVVRGLCAGSALGLAAAADFMITDTTTRIRLPEVKVGLIPGNGATWFLPRRMGPAVAKYYSLTASPMSGEQAVGWGLAQGFAGDDASGFIAELRKTEGSLDRPRILSLLEKKGGTREALREEVHELPEKIDRHFGFGKANRGYLGDIFASMERSAAQGDLFAQESLASMRSASAQAVWVTEFLVDTFAQDGLYGEDEARAVELKFAQEMTAGFAHMEGVLGLAKGIASAEFDSRLDRIVLSDARGFRTSIPATPDSTGCRLSEDAPFLFEGNEYVLPRGDYHCGEKNRTLAPGGEAARTVAFRIDLRNSQWSDGTVADELGVLRSLMETQIGWRVVRRAWLANPEKFELDMVYPYAWSVRPSVSLDLRSFPVIRRFEDGKINPARAIFDQLDAQGLLDERRVINIGEDQKDGKNVDVKSFTYRQIRREANRLANVLVDMGVAPGDMVVIYMSTDIMGLVAQLAATLAGATYHFVFGAKGPDIFSDTVYNMGAKVIITEDGYRVGDRSRELKKDSVDVAMSRYVPRTVLLERLASALSTPPEEPGEEARGIAAAVTERLAGKVTYSRDSMREFLEVVHEAHIKRVVLSSLDEAAGEELRGALRTRDETIRRAKARVAAATRDERVFERYAPVLAAALRGVPAAADPGDSGDPWARRRTGPRRRSVEPLGGSPRSRGGRDRGPSPRLAEKPRAADRARDPETDPPGSSGRGRSGRRVGVHPPPRAAEGDRSRATGEHRAAKKGHRPDPFGLRGTVGARREARRLRSVNAAWPPDGGTHDAGPGHPLGRCRSADG